LDNLEEFASICIRETRCTEIAFPTLTPVVGVPGEDLLGAIELLFWLAFGSRRVFQGFVVPVSQG
jgi:hypothetical protein